MRAVSLLFTLSRAIFPKPPPVKQPKHAHNQTARSPRTPQPHAEAVELLTYKRSRSFTLLHASLLCLLPLSAIAAGLEPNEQESIYRELQQPIRLTLTNGRTLLGHSIRVSGDQLQVGTSAGAGEAIFTFKIDEIGSYKIPGESYKALAVEWFELGDSEKAIELFELLYNQRVNLIPLLPASESHFFIYYVELILNSQNPARAIAITEVLRPQIKEPAALRTLDDAILESYDNLKLYDEACKLAKAWVATRDPYGGSALGYYVLGSAKLREEDYDAALHLALQPIIFSSHIPIDKLAHSYAVAISAALGLRKPGYAITLYHEMQSRKLIWPEDNSTLEPFYKKLLKQLEDT
jgi:tetratricopeptide (TPR) repeat protein